MKKREIQEKHWRIDKQVYYMKQQQFEIQSLKEQNSAEIRNQKKIMLNNPYEYLPLKSHSPMRSKKRSKAKLEQEEED
jgi:hypothetical protein